MSSSVVDDATKRITPSNTCSAVFSQGEKDQQGELFGIQNLLRYSSSSILKDLRKKYDELSATGAVRSLRDGDDASKMDSDAAPNAEGGLHLVGDMDAADQAEMGVLVYECAAVSTQPEKTSER